MSGRYDFSYTRNSPYAHMVDLLGAHAPADGLILDLGCGVGTVAEPVADLGFTYVGCDIDVSGLEPLKQRGFETHLLDLSDVDNLAERLDKIIDGRPVSAILMLDALEHLPDTEAFLFRLRDCSLRLGRPLLGLSIPNIGHFDVGAKLVTGRWDMTDTGLLDRTHLQFFTEERLRESMTRWGWIEVARNDLELHHSDQHFPPDHPALADGAPLRDLLWRLRRRISGNLVINQFVRLFTLASVSIEHAPQEEPPAPFLTVLVRTQGRRMANLLEALTCLAAQTDDDLEVQVLVHNFHPEALTEVREMVGTFAPQFAARVHVRQVADGRRACPLNLGIDVARGRYLAFLDDDDLVTADWVEGFREGAEDAPGRIIRSITADRKVRRHEGGSRAIYKTLSGLQMSHTATFNMLEHFWQNRTPICSFAVPMTAVRALGMRFDEQAVVLEDWNFLMELALLCGVRDTGRVTSVYHRWEGPESSLTYVDAGIWETTRTSILQRLDEGPLLLPAGSASSIARLWQQVLLAEMERENIDARLAVHDANRAMAVAEAGELRTQIDDLHHHLDDARQHAIDERSRAHQLEQELMSVRSSRVWRLLRVVRRLTRGLRHAGFSPARRRR